MYPYWYQAPYWYNYYYYYFYKYPLPLRDDVDYSEDEYKEDDYQRDEMMRKYRSPDGQDELPEEMPIEGEYVPSPPTQYPIGSLGYYGSLGEFTPGGPFGTQQAVLSADAVLAQLEENNPEILTAMTSFNIPYNTARDILRRIVEATLSYCR